MATRHFLTLLDLSQDELRYLIQRAITIKNGLKAHGPTYTPFTNRTLAMIFEKSSTRTRVSFETAMAQFGGHALFLSPRDTQLGRGEPIGDTARVLSEMVDAVMIRTFSHQGLEEFAAASDVPVINALTDDYHPCQLLADVMTWTELRGSVKGRTAVWIGDGNNMCHSWINAARQFDFKLRICCPEGYDPREDILAAAGDRVVIERDPMTAVAGADLVTTDVWASMGQEEEQARREADFAGFQVTEAMLDAAAKDVLFLHCLPAHRGEEISETLLDDPRAVVWQEAGNRLHAQKALLEFLMLGQVNG
ncbi:MULTISPECIES: ornithine carbamoyltransferase [Halomonas]|uniref:Ornithine carbamoyltransferase n=3 Tax=Halomonas TaxID=2745 RepID=A0AAU7KCF7_9GAMM|nr:MULTISPECIES: ornithine carbamoyltransferase [Halomonas]MBR9771264.1 ornithine carbamoyltransferase [Gammaproteobacteria bacterium]KJZ05864.1 ornithine carbamoyltransferase [Halomonas sp. S2151]MAY70510.1 ornithine carbamoyltransferase [Halomonas sp.]MBR9880235.1 ornithine carbamoyltransferase [Gammaproteobacteria bacterium]MBS8268199.1 ornithine carbamoyltransferase [Halomonas litopenaei]